MRRFITPVLWIIPFFFFVGSFLHIHAQELNIAQRFAIQGTVPNGSLISSGDGTYHLSSETYDKALIGVAIKTPAVELKTSATEDGTYPVVSQGIVSVRVNSENGAIHSGDMVTSSSTAGVGMKANKSGFIVGIAQGDFTGTSEGMIPVSLAIKFAFASDSPTSEKIGTNLLNVIKLSSIGALEDPVVTMRYVLSAAIVVVSLVLTFFTVARVVRNGIEALGRNPLASKAITLAIAGNIFVSLAIMGAGVAAAWIVSTL